MDESSKFAYSLYESIIRLTNQNSNSVLSVLPEGEIIAEVKYPAGFLTFSNDKWKAYYHYHHSPLTSVDEHGHFHLFHQLTSHGHKPHDGDWAHVACLTVDSMGQPLDWVLVNRWVTAGLWLTAQNLIDSLQGLVSNHGELLTKMAPVEGWLLSLLGLYSEELVMLYSERDTYIESLQTGGSEIFEDREIYELARYSIQLADKLSRVLPATP